jgi:2C-methyl-D-erythritol 2,4-cyclodiphosphate synthase
MSDAITAAQMISTSLFTSQIGDMFAATRARNNDAAEIAALQALVQRLANYGRHVEQQHNSLLAEAKKIDAQRCQQINAQLDEIAALRAKLENLTSTSAQRAEESRNDYNRLVEDFNLLLRDYRALREKSSEQS